MKSSAVLLAGVLGAMAIPALSATPYYYRQPTPGVRLALPVIGDGVSKEGACATGAATGCATFPLGLQFVSSWAFGTYLPQASVAPKTSGKWYFEVTGMSGNSYVFLAENQKACLPANGTLNYFKELINGGSTYSTVYGVALNVDAATATLYKDGVQMSVIPLGTPNVVRVQVASNICGANVSFRFNFGQSAFIYPVPAGFNAGLW